MRENWTYKKLGEVTTTINGLWTGKKPPFINVAVVRNTNFTKDCKLDMTNVAYLDVEQKQYNSRKLLPGDIIIEKSGGSDKQPVGRPVLFDIPDGEYSFSNFTSTLRINNTKEIIPHFLHCALYSAYLRGETFKLQSKTTGIHNLDFKGYTRLPIPVPPLSEQQAIVSELDKINELISLKKAQLSDLDALAQSIFYDMFGDPIENEKGWEVKKLGEIGIIGDGLHGTPQYDDNGDCYFINGNNLESGRIIITKATKKVNEIERAKYYIEFTSNTLFVSINGTLGKVAFYNNENIILGKSACYIILDVDINKTYIYNIIKSRYFFDYMKNEYTGSTIKNISLKSMRNLPIPLPPLSLQQDFAKRIELIEKQKAQISSTIKDLETLLASRMQYWFD